MKTIFATISCLLLTYGTSLAQGVFEAPLSLSLGESASLFAGIGYFRATGTTVDYELLVYDLTAGSLSPVIATTSFESSFATGLGQVITVSGCNPIPPNPFLPLPGPPGPITCPAQMSWADYWGTFSLPAEQVAELLSQGGLLRIAGTSGFLGSGGEVQGVVSPVPEPSSFVLLSGGLLWLIRSKSGKVAQPGAPPNGGPGALRGDSGALQGAAIGELARWAFMQRRSLIQTICVAASVFLFSACATNSRKGVHRLKTCGDYMCMLTLGAQEWSMDHGGYMPAELGSLTNELVSPRYFVCPGDHSRRPALDWQSFTPDQVSYQVVTPRLRVGDTNSVFLRCRVHPDHVSYADGTVLEGKGRRRPPDAWQAGFSDTRQPSAPPALDVP
jgi:hypothetical protein